MKKVKQKLLMTLTLLSSILFTTGCAPKNTNGSYASTYSYHSYLKNNQPLVQNIAPPRQQLFSPQYQANPNVYSSNQRAKAPSFQRQTSTVHSKIEQTAKSLLGTDYQYGANGPYQYDCSSFTKYVFAKQGITIPRVSRDQAKEGQYIRSTQLQKGDLVFFDSKKSTKVSHVGIYLGRGDFIHASSAKDKVVISNLGSNYYSKHFKWGRRVTNVSYAMR